MGSTISTVSCSYDYSVFVYLKNYETIYLVLHFVITQRIKICCGLSSRWRAWIICFMRQDLRLFIRFWRSLLFLFCSFPFHYSWEVDDVDYLTLQYLEDELRAIVRELCGEVVGSKHGRKEGSRLHGMVHAWKPEGPRASRCSGLCYIIVSRS